MKNKFLVFLYSLGRSLTRNQKRETRNGFLAILFLLPALLFADEVYFSPHGHVREQIVSRIRSCRVTLDIAMYSLTSKDIAQALAQARKRGVRVRVIRDISQTSDRGDEDAFLEQAGIEVRLLKGLGRGIMHDKFAVFDGREGLTGSYNWTQNAELDNYENAYFFGNPRTLQAYEQEFTRLWDIAVPLRARSQPNSWAAPVRGHPLLSVLGLFAVLLALAAALTT